MLILLRLGYVAQTVKTFRVLSLRAATWGYLEGLNNLSVSQPMLSLYLVILSALHAFEIETTGYCGVNIEAC
jgi:hypothetical protein